MILTNLDHACSLAVEHLNRSIGQRARWILLDIRTQASAARALVDARFVRELRARDNKEGA